MSKFKILAITISTNILSRIKKEKIAANYAINCAEILLDFVVTVIAVAPFFFSIIIVGVNVSDKRGNRGGDSFCRRQMTIVITKSCARTGVSRSFFPRKRYEGRVYTTNVKDVLEAAGEIETEK